MKTIINLMIFISFFCLIMFISFGCGKSDSALDPITPVVSDGEEEEEEDPGYCVDDRVNDSPFANSSIDGIDGLSEGNAFTICTQEQLNNIDLTVGDNTCDYCDKFFKLARNITMTYTGTQFHIIGNNESGSSATHFSGTFDGAGYKITDFAYDDNSDNDVGFFGYAISTAVIKNLRLVNCDVTGNESVGCLVGYLTGGQVIDSGVSGTVTGAYRYVAGIVGETDNGATINGSYAEIDAVGGEYVGGLIGYAPSISGSIGDCYTSGSVDGTNYVGGIAGTTWMNPAQINRVYSKSQILGISNEGGFIGYRSASDCSDCYWDYEIAGLPSTQDLGNGGGSGAADIDGMTTVQMKQQATYSGFDFDTVWGIDEGNGTPYLRWTVE